MAQSTEHLSFDERKANIERNSGCSLRSAGDENPIVAETGERDQANEDRLSQYGQPDRARARYCGTGDVELPTHPRESIGEPHDF